MSLVAKIRRYRGYTQSDMASFLNISLQSYYRKEHGKTPFNDKEKVIIKNLFSEDFPNLTIDNIFFDEKYQKLKNNNVDLKELK